MHWTRLSPEDLLAVPIKDLGLELETSPLQARLAELQAELERRSIPFRPYAWLSTEWFTPDDATGFAIPFYLAHPRLVRLERAQMLEVEGATRRDCMKIMRHEAAHALDNAYGLRKRRRWREVFGPATAPYSSAYTPDPNSRAYVQHLDYWYAQSHPLEDFAETFAVWLQPGSRWRRRYEGWPALEKLSFMDELMRSLESRPPIHRTRRREEPLHRVRMTLGEYYEQKKEIYASEGTPAFNGQLRHSFPRGEGRADEAPRLAPFLRRHRTRLVRQVASATGQHRYLLDHVVREMTLRARTEDLRIPRGEEGALLDSAILLTSLSSQFVYGGHPRYQR
ncbi:MAG: putative zinc-binding metallopeptidase [Planctomycetota bacterium]|nr:putative zinc-binding metallopeptidase [Planctomycetota bacterium]